MCPDTGALKPSGSSTSIWPGTLNTRAGGTVSGELQHENGGKRSCKLEQNTSQVCICPSVPRLSCLSSWAKLPEGQGHVGGELLCPTSWHAFVCVLSTTHIKHRLASSRGWEPIRWGLSEMPQVFPSRAERQVREPDSGLGWSERQPPLCSATGREAAQFGVECHHQHTPGSPDSTFQQSSDTCSLAARPVSP